MSNLKLTYPDFYHNKSLSRRLVINIRNEHSLWNKNSLDYGRKDVKTEAWEKVANSLNTTSTVCRQRWKSLREKYLREKSRDITEEQWDFLPLMSFIDDFINTRDKRFSANFIYTNRQAPSSTFSVNSAENSNEYIEIDSDSLSPNAPNEEIDESNLERSYDSDSDVVLIIGDNDPLNCEEGEINTNKYPEEQIQNTSYSNQTKYNQEPDYCTIKCLPSNKRKRSLSSCSDYSSLATTSTSKKYSSQNEESGKESNEQIFANLVANMLSKKSEEDKNRAMLAIMKILTE